MDYRLLSVFALVLWGTWGFFAKTISGNISPQGLAFWSTLATVVPVAVFALTESTGKWTRPHPMALGAGLAYGLASPEPTTFARLRAGSSAGCPALLPEAPRALPAREVQSFGMTTLT